MKFVNQSIRKKDAMQLVTGQPVYTDDLAPKDCLIVKVLRSPHANAIIESINTMIASKVPDIEAIFTYEDVDQNGKRCTYAGQTYPEPSPYDRLLLDRHVRFVGDVVAIVAGKTEKAVDKAMSLIKVKYNVLEPVLDFHKALDNPILVHPEDTWESLVPVGADNKRNLCAHEVDGHGDIDAVMADCDIIIDRTYRVKAVQQDMMEPFCTFCTIDTYGRLNVVSSTQIVFHARRNIANALHLPKTKVRVTKPRIGGGFGAKQSCVSELYPAFVTWRLKKPSKIVYSREECHIAASPRHEMEVTVRLGATKEGKIRAIDLYTLSNTGAYGEHGPTTVGLSGHKSIPLYRTEAHRFSYDVVYTNLQAAGAYRGYGAPQGIFAVESAVNELAAKLNIDPITLREMNITREGDIMHAYYGAPNTSCALDKCLAQVREMSGWDEKFPKRIMPDGKVRTMGVAIAMQGSSIPFCDVGGADIKLQDDGTYTLRIGAADMGTGCDTVLAQMAADVLECDVDDIVVFGADTDTSPYDSGSYASSTTYITGNAVHAAAMQVREKICQLGAKLLECSVEEVVFDGKTVRNTVTDKAVSLFDVGVASQVNNDIALEAVVEMNSVLSPPPFMAGVAEMETDLLTGETHVVNYYASVDCGTPINPNLAKVQTEGGLLQGIGMTLMENVTYSPKGRIYENSFMQYKVPCREDIGHIHVDFACSYEDSSAFGAKSIGELVINTPGPAIADAIYQATGHRFFVLPITPEKIAMGEENE
ncbi:xanthine dehydrogenase family protein molybdopterin-binding subunit [Phascolarctobacterium sp.]|uniref:xanthine dehydrogenase family protein molybdopterin-binding subunit n=1 Tax=Phascolarctobacterium sp. TaxID=2049039 RepID=UPI0038651921